MRILVTGASGLLGKSLCPLLDEEGWQYWACNSKIFDVTNTKMVNEIMDKISLDFIIHLAGYTNIDQAEDNPELAYNVNQIGTYELEYTINQNGLKKSIKRTVKVVDIKLNENINYNSCL